MWIVEIILLYLYSCLSLIFSKFDLCFYLQAGDFELMEDGNGTMMDYQVCIFFICYPANCYPSQGWWMLKVMKVRFCLMNSLLEIASMPRAMSVRIGFLFIKNMKGRQRVHCWLTSLEPNQRIVHWLWFWRRRDNFLLQLQDGGSLGGSVEDYSPHGRDSR